MIDPVEMTSDEYQGHRDEYNGLCVECGEITDGGVEPDAQRIQCECCECFSVYGIEECLMNNLITITE